eukprot:scaffold73641_cov46-Attheya_sp.AAC.2
MPILESDSVNWDGVRVDAHDAAERCRLRCGAMMTGYNTGGGTMIMGNGIAQDIYSVDVCGLCRRSVMLNVAKRD